MQRLGIWRNMVPAAERLSAFCRRRSVQQSHGSAAATPRQHPQCPPALGNRQKAGWQPPPESSDVRGGGGVPAHAHPRRGEARAPRKQVASTPDGSVIKQLLFAEGLVGLGGVVSRPRSVWRDKAVAALSPVLMSGWRGGIGMALRRTPHRRTGVPFVTAPSPLFDPPLNAALNTFFVGPLPVTLTPTPLRPAVGGPCGVVMM
eukprot:363590-Chlamydomonas_euryale.AAC.9